MVVVSFSMEKLLYKILRGEKHQTFRVLKTGETGESAKKWEAVLRKFQAREQVILNLCWKQRSPAGLRIGDVPLTDIGEFDMHLLSKEDATRDGMDSLGELESFFQNTYGDGWRELRWVRVQWATVPNANLVKPNSTKIDWFEELCTVNPLVFPKGCPYECSYCYAHQMQCVRKLPNLVPGIYPGRLAGIQFAAKHVFMESMGDLFHPNVPDALIRYVIHQCNSYNSQNANLYFLTKNPLRYCEFLPTSDQNLITEFNPLFTWIGTTVETDTYGDPAISKASSPIERLQAFTSINYPRKFISIEPVMKFSSEFADLIVQAKPQLVFVGANTSSQKLIEPDPAAVETLIKILQEKGLTVVRKQNLARLEEPSENIPGLMPGHNIPICPKCTLPITEHVYSNFVKCHCAEKPQPEPPKSNGKTLLITGCCKEKLDHPAPAKDLYQGRLFKLVKAYAETNSFNWIIISAEYGLVTPDQVLEPYDTQIKTAGDVKRVHQLVMPALESIWGDYAKIILILGKRYRQVIEPELTQLPPQKIVIIEDKRGIGGLCQQIKALLPRVVSPKKPKHITTGAERAMRLGYTPLDTFFRRVV